MKRPPLSAIASNLLLRCARILNAPVDALLEEFQLGLKPESENPSRKLVEFCCSRTIGCLCCSIEEKISDRSFSRFTFDMMLAWECPCSISEQCYDEGLAKDKEDRKHILKGNGAEMDDDIPLFYSDLMPLLVDEEGSVGEDAFVWLASLLPLIADVVNARFTFETLTAPTSGQLHFPAYDRFLKEMDKCIQYLQKQQTPTGVKLAGDEFILHVEGTANTHRVVRHIGPTSWPGRLTLSNQALYFEASGAISYETALKIDLSKVDINQRVKATLTGPWGVPLFDKAIIYESSQQSEPVILEFPEMTSSTRRDHWLALLKEIILLHEFIARYNLESPRAWEIQARTVLGVLRLHAAREMLRISPPSPTNFLIFSLLDDLPKGDYVLENLSNSLKALDKMEAGSATSILKGLNLSFPIVSSSVENEEKVGEKSSEQPNSLESLDAAINQVREEAKEASAAKATIKELKEEGISDSILILMELLSPLKNKWSRFEEILAWKKPTVTSAILATTLLITYKEWVGYAVAICFVGVLRLMLWARRTRMRDKYIEILVPTPSGKMTMETIAAAQHALNNFRAIIQAMNIAIFRIQSILVSRAPKHADLIMLVALGMAIVLVMLPFKWILMGLTVYFFAANSSTGKSSFGDQGNRRLREWWESIPVGPIRIINST